MGLIDSFKAKLEIYRLEQRYTRRDKRTTFTSGAQYVDGEYVYGNECSISSPATSTSSGSTGRNSIFAKMTPGVKVTEIWKGGDERRRSKAW